MPLNLVEAGAAAGRSKSSILRAIKRGALSARRDDTTGGWCIEEAELYRAFPPEPMAVARGTSRNRTGGPTIRELEARLEAERAKTSILEEVVGDLRRRLDRADERLTAILADQRAAPVKVSWWWWLRR